MVTGEFFENVINEYVDGRPRYPKELIAYIKDYSGIDEKSRLLDIGAGPGTATDEFINHYVDVLEISENQVKYLEDKYRDKGNIRVYQSKFEEFKTENKYDLVYSAQAWHWVDQRMGLDKAYSILKNGGTLALFWDMTYRMWPRQDVLRDLGDIFDRYYPSGHSFGTQQHTDYLEIQRAESLLSHYGFFLVEKKEFCKEEVFDANRFINWMKTWTDIWMNPDYDHESCESEIREYFKGTGGEIPISMTTYLTIAQKKDVSEYVEFVPSCEIDGIIKLNDYIENPDLVGSFFMTSGAQILYLCDVFPSNTFEYDANTFNGGRENIARLRMIGCTTTMDVIRFYSGKQKYLFNRKYVFLCENSPSKAKAIFDQRPNIHEIPVYIGMLDLRKVHWIKRK